MSTLEADQILGMLERHREGLRRMFSDVTDGPDAPWYPPNASWSIREVLLHILAETTQHVGHADIMKETLRAR